MTKTLYTPRALRSAPTQPASRGAASSSGALMHAHGAHPGDGRASRRRHEHAKVSRRRESGRWLARVRAWAWVVTMRLFSSTAGSTAGIACGCGDAVVACATIDRKALPLAPPSAVHQHPRLFARRGDQHAPSPWERQASPRSRPSRSPTEANPHTLGHACQRGEPEVESPKWRAGG